MAKKMFEGSGGGGGPSTTPDNLLSEDVVEFALAVSEGPIRGLTNGAYSFFVGDTPLVGPTGTRNFDKFAVGVHPGYAEGAASPLKMKLGGISSSFNVGVTLQKNNPVTRQTQAQLRGNVNTLEVRIFFTRLVDVGSDGSTKKNTAHFKIEAAPVNGGAWKMFDIPPIPANVIKVGRWFEIEQPSSSNNATEMTITGKTSSGYAVDFRLDVPKMDNDDWSIRVTKLSPDNDEHNVVDMVWESFQAVTKGDATFPDTAIVHGIGLANGQFSNIPDFSGIYDGLVVRVPTNYNPDARTYNETTPWDGSFKFAWTNNPAWILYDLIVNQRYGLAKHRRYVDANRFSFYEAAKWCDQSVAISGSTDTRPRYTFNMVLSEVRPGLEMLQYVAGSFNALIWDDLQGQIHLRVDKDDPAVMVFTPENVTEEGFSYTFTDITSRANDISVAFINPDLDWNEDRRRIPGVTTNEESIQKHGRIPMDFIAVGCTNLHEAIAKAQVRLISAQTETMSVSFTTTRLGALLSLYDVVLVADPMMGWSQTGRLTTFDANYVYFRDPLYIETMQSYTMKFQTSNGLFDVTVAPEATGPVTKMRLQTALPANLPKYAVFSIQGTASSFGYAKPFRVMSITPADDSPYMYTIVAMEINRNKYTQVEGDPTNVGDDFNYSVKVPYLPGAPVNFTATSGPDQVQILPTGEVVARIYASWEKPYGGVVNGYVLQYRLTTDGDTDWITINATVTNAYISPVVVGQTYMLRVAALDGNNRQSDWVNITNHLAKGKSKVPDKLFSAKAVGGLFQITLSWDFGANPAPDLSRVEIWGGTSNDRNQSTKFTDLAYPTTSWVHVGLSMGVTLFYWIRVQDSSGNYSPWSDMITGTSTSDASQIVNALNGQITTSQLFGDLKSRIDLIDGPESLTGSVNARIKTMVDQFGQEGAAATVAAINSLNDVSATSDSANARTLYQLKAQVNDAQTGLPAATAAITQLNNVSATSTSAAAKAIYQVTSRLNNIGGVTLESAYSTQANAISGLSGQYTLKIDNNGYIAGFGLSSTSSAADGNTSVFIIYADKMGIVMPGFNNVQPFTVGVVGGKPQVVLTSALIGDAQIDSLKLAGEAVTVPVSVSCYKAFSGQGKGNYMVITEGYFKMTDPGILYALFTGAATFPTGDKEWRMKMRINGVDRQEIGGAKFNDAPSLSSSCSVPAGVNHVEVLWYATEDRVKILTSTLFMQATKK